MSSLGGYGSYSESGSSINGISLKSSNTPHGNTTTNNRSSLDALGSTSAADSGDNNSNNNNNCSHSITVTVADVSSSETAIAPATATANGESADGCDATALDSSIAANSSSNDNENGGDYNDGDDESDVVDAQFSKGTLQHRHVHVYKSHSYSRKSIKHY